MIRFVDLRNAGIADVQFAFWDTELGQFVWVGDEQGWKTWAEFESAVSAKLRFPLSSSAQHTFLDSLRELCPGWVHEESADE